MIREQFGLLLVYDCRVDASYCWHTGTVHVSEFKDLEELEKACA